MGTEQSCLCRSCLTYRVNDKDILRQGDAGKDIPDAIPLPLTYISTGNVIQNSARYYPLSGRDAMFDDI